MIDINYDLIRTILKSCSSVILTLNADKDSIFTHYKLLIENGIIEQGMVFGTHALSEHDEIIYKISKCRLTAKGYEFVNCLNNDIADLEIRNLRLKNKTNYNNYVFNHLKETIINK